MSDIAILKKILKNTATVSLEEDRYGKKQVTLREPDLPDCSVIIHGMPNDDQVIVIKADTFRSPNTVFTGSKGECKRADFVIIADIDRRKVILCVEMKAKVKTSSEEEIIQQLKGAKCFVVYCQEIGKTFWEQKKFLDDYIYRFVTIRNINIHKQQTRDKITDDHDIPKRMLKISSPHYLQFNRLIGWKK